MRHILSAACIMLFAVLSQTVRAQVEVLSECRKQAYEAMVPELEKNVSPDLREHLKNAARVSSENRTAKINAVRVAGDFKNQDTAGFVWYDVPPISETQYLPDVYPFDGEAGKPVRIVSAQDEYEPGSFVIYPLKNLGKAQFEVSDLKSADGSILPKEELDLKTVKVWYQNGNGWYSYFSDPGKKLCPELLLNDEDLILADKKKELNYARFTEKNGKIRYQLINVPKNLNYDFPCMVPEYQDAEKFLGQTLTEGEFKQFFLTAHVKKGQNPGLYHGQIILRSAGEVIGSIPVELRVLPFVLPLPMTYRDLNKEYRDFMSGYISLPILRQLNGGDHELAKKQLDAIMIDMVKHGDKMPCHYERYIAPEWAEKCGMDNSMFIADAGGMRLDFPAVMQFDARRKVEAMDRKFGTHKNHYLDWGDEFDSKMLRAIRPMVDTYKNAGLRYANNSRGGYVYGLYIIDFYRIPVTPDFANNVLADKVSFIGGDHYFGWYADQHVGPENPAFCRRQYGLGPYRAGLSCNRNYAHHLGGYNDNSGTFRSMNFFYGDGKGVIDTIAWEGYREGIDDIRYATLLQQLARPLTQSDNFRAKYAARIALQFLADMNTDSFDLSAARLEMIRHILKLQKFSK